MSNRTLKKQRVIPYAQMEKEFCSKTAGKTHKIWHSYVGDHWPAFCSNGCGTVANDPPIDENP